MIIVTSNFISVKKYKIPITAKEGTNTKVTLTLVVHLLMNESSRYPLPASNLYKYLPKQECRTLHKRISLQDLLCAAACPSACNSHMALSVSINYLLLPEPSHIRIFIVLSICDTIIVYENNNLPSPQIKQYP